MTALHTLRTAIQRAPLPILASVVVVVLFIQAYSPAWQSHLQTDVIIHHQQANEYWQSGSWHNISFKEYQPGALWFFLVPHALAGFTNNYSVYLTGTLFINALLIVGHAWILRRFAPPGAVLVFLGMLLAMGPILLYRFELIVSLLVLIAWLLFRRGSRHLPAYLLGLATITKLYPIILLPVFMAESVRQKNRAGALALLGWFLAGVATIVIPFLVFGGTISDIITSFSTYTTKPVALDGVWGSVLTLWWGLISSAPLALDSSHGIHGLILPTTIFPLGFYDRVWMLPYGIALVGLLWLYRRRGYTTPYIPVLLLAVFTLSSKVLNPQYVWWFLSLLPLIPLARWPKWWQVSVLCSVLLSLFLAQLVYPTNYFAFLDWFYGRSPDAGLFIVSVLRNVLLVLFVGLMVGAAIVNRHRRISTYDPT